MSVGVIASERPDRAPPPPAATRAVPRPPFGIPPDDADSVRWYAQLRAAIEECPPDCDVRVRRWLATTRLCAPETREVFSYLRPIPGGAVHDDDRSAQRFDDEVRARDQIAEPLLASLRQSDPDAFLEALMRLAAAMGQMDGFRRGQMATHVNAAGVYIEFPPAELIRPQLTRLFHFLRETFEVDPIRAALVAYVASQNIHPFPDANGRIGRVLFNVLLTGCSRRFDVPLRALNEATDGGLLVSVRHAEAGVRWNELILFLTQSIRLLYTII